MPELAAFARSLSSLSRNANVWFRGSSDIPNSEILLGTKFESFPELMLLWTLTGPFPKSSGTFPQIRLEPSQNCARNLRKWSELTQSCLVALYSLKPMAFCWGNILWRRMSTAFPILEALEWNTKTIKTSFGDMYPHQQKHLKQPEPPFPKTCPETLLELAKTCPESNLWPSRKVDCLSAGVQYHDDAASFASTKLFFVKVSTMHINWPIPPTWKLSDTLPWHPYTCKPD